MDGFRYGWKEGGREGQGERKSARKGERARERKRGSEGGKRECEREREGGGAGEKRRRTALAASRSAAPRFDRSDVVRSGPLPSEQARRMLAAPLPLSCYISPRPLVTTGRGEQMPILPALTNARPL